MQKERESFIDNLLVRVRYIIVVIPWTGLAPWEFGFPFPGSVTSTFLDTWETLLLPLHLQLYHNLFYQSNNLCIVLPRAVPGGLLCYHWPRGGCTVGFRL